MSSPSPPASNVYNIFAFCSWLPPPDPFGVLPGNSLMNAAGGGAISLFFRTDPPPIVDIGLVLVGTSGAASSTGLWWITLDLDRSVLAALPEDRLLMVLDLDS